MAVELHQGGCHCGAVRFTARLDLAQPVVVCNCSICRKSGAMLSVVADDDFTLQSGEAALTTYRFNNRVIGHRFCSTCGVKSFAAFEGGGVAINVRTLDGVDPSTLQIMPFDGASA